MTTAIQKRDERETLEAILKRPAYADRFKQVLGDKAAQFCSSLVSIGRTMPDVEPKSIVGSSMIAACLDLPIEKNLGFAWIVPYKKGDQKLAQFQMGYKGYIQLALRTGYYGGMNACAVNTEAYGGRDTIGEPIILWDKIDESKEAVGYAFAFRMVNGFSKICYWTKKKVQDHAQRYSQSYRAGFDSPWKTHFDRMAIKTVIANELSDWGILSVQFQLARKSDQGVVKDIDAEVEFIDNDGPDQVEDRKPEPTTLQQSKEGSKDGKGTKKADVKAPNKAPETPPAASTPVTTPPEGQKPQAEPVVNATTTGNAPEGSFEAAEAAKSAESDEKEEAAAGLAPEMKEDLAATAMRAASFSPNPKETPELQNVRYLLHKHGKTEEQLLPVLLDKKLRKDNQKLADLATGKLVNIGKSWIVFLEAMK